MRKKDIFTTCIIVAVIIALSAVACILYFHMQNNILLTDGTLI